MEQNSSGAEEQRWTLAKKSRFQQPLGPMPAAAELLQIDPHQYRIWVRVFGRLRVFVEYEELQPRDWPYPKVANLFRYLVLQHHSLPLDTVLEVIWPNLAPTRGRHNFSVALHHLRSTLEPHRKKHHDSSLITYQNQQVRLNHSQILSDRNLFLQLARRANQLPPGSEEYKEALTAMTSLYAGPLLADEPCPAWCLPEQSRLEEIYLMSLEELARLWLDQNHPAATVRYCQQLLAVDPLREGAHSLLLRAYMQLGRRTKALGHYEDLIARLDQELGMKPNKELEELHRQLLAGNL